MSRPTHRPLIGSTIGHSKHMRQADRVARCWRWLVALMLACLGGLLAPAALAQTSLGQAVVIIIANTNYSQTDDVAYAKRDADAFEVFARDVLQARVYRYDDMGTNQMGEFFGIDGRPGGMTNHILAPNTDLYIYYAGHGTHDAPDGGQKARNYIMPVDANPDQRYLERQAYALDDLKRSLTTLRNGLLKQGRVTLVLESCFSGLSPSADGGASKGLVQGVSAPPLGRAQPLDADGIRLWAATSPDTDYAVWDTEFQRGVFTDSLLSGLHAGRADANGDYKVTAGEMRTFVQGAVNRRVAALGQGGASFQQRPIFVGMDDSEVVVSYPASRYPSYSTDQERAYVERFLGEELIQAASDALNQGALADMTKAANGLRDYLTQCSFCNERDEVNHQLASLNDVLSACKVEGRFLDRILADKNMSRLGRLLDRLECEQMRGATQACLTSGDFGSEACGCLADQTCRVAATSQVNVCQQDYDQLATNAGTTKDTGAFARFIRDRRADCSEQVAVAEQTMAALCRDLARRARVGLSSAKREGLEAYIASNRDCLPEIKAAREQLVSLAEKEEQAACTLIFDQVSGKENKSALASFIRANPKCSKEIVEANRQIDALARKNDAATCKVNFSRVNGHDNAAVLARFIRSNPSCSTEIAEANRQIDALARKNDAATCKANFSRVSGNDDAAVLRRFIRSNPSCNTEIAEANRQIDAINNVERRCQRAFENAQDEQTSQALAKFMQSYPHCTAQIPDAARLMVYLQEQEDKINTPPANPYPYDGVYVGRRGYTDSGRPSKSKWCLSRYNFTMTVQNHYVSFNSDGRYWQGFINDQGYVTIEHSGISPAPNHQTYISGPLNNAQLYNGYCGYGYFTVQRQ